jgi:hypothetical protein
MNTYQKVLFHTACKAISEELQDKRKFHQIIRQEGKQFWLENFKEENESQDLLSSVFLTSSIILSCVIGIIVLITIFL